MLLRIFLIALILVMVFHFISRLFRAMFTRPPEQDPPKKKTVRDIDDSQIQDADFKDL